MLFCLKIYGVSGIFNLALLLPPGSHCSCCLSILFSCFPQYPISLMLSRFFWICNKTLSQMIMWLNICMVMGIFYHCDWHSLIITLVIIIWWLCWKHQQTPRVYFYKIYWELVWLIIDFWITANVKLKFS